MKHKNFLLIIIFCLSLFYVQAVEKPDWVDSWRTIYPDAIYVAQLGKATGKNGALDAKNVAANTVAQYLNSKVESEINSFMQTSTGQDKNGKLVTSFERQNKQNITISVDLSLTSLLFTEPWYNKKEKTWYCVAYAEREKLWEQYVPTLQHERDKLFAFYRTAEESSEPIFRIKYYGASKEYEEDFFTAYSYARILSIPLTEKNFQNDAKLISSVRAKTEREKINCTFSINTQGDVNNTIYQSLKAALSEEGFTVKNSGEDAAYIVNANILLSDTEIQNIHVIKPTIDITITGKTAAVFSYSRQAENASGIDKEVASNKAVRLLKLEIEKSFMNEFNDVINHKTQADIQKLF